MLDIRPVIKPSQAVNKRLLAEYVQIDAYKPDRTAEEGDRQSVKQDLYAKRNNKRRQKHPYREKLRFSVDRKKSVIKHNTRKIGYGKEHEEYIDLVKKADYIITDSEATTRYLKREMKTDLSKIVDISPYDSRMDFGISEQLTVQKILVPVDDLPKERFKLLMINLAAYLQTKCWIPL